MRLLVHKNAGGAWYVRAIGRIGGRVSGVPYAGPFGCWADAQACANRTADRWRKP